MKKRLSICLCLVLALSLLAGCGAQKAPAAAPTAEELAAWYRQSGLPLKRFFNTSGLLYKSLQLKEKLPAMTEQEQLDLLATDGMLVKRPLLITPRGVCPGFREAEWKALLS